MADDKNREQNSFTPDQRLQLSLRIVDRVTSFLMLSVKAVVWVVIAFKAVRIMEALAGKETNVGVSVSTAGNFVVTLLSRWGSEKYAWSFAVVAILYGFVERKLRQRKTRYLQARIVQLEKLRDPQRESSGLTPTGETNKEDKL